MGLRQQRRLAWYPFWVWRQVWHPAWLLTSPWQDHPADPLGDLAKAKSEARPDAKPDAKPKTDTKPDAAAGVDPFSYFIQAGAFRTPEDAEAQRAKLSLMGFQAKVTEREQSGRTVYRVRLGPFDKKDEADKTKEKLDGNAIETALVRVQR